VDPDGGLFLAAQQAAPGFPENQGLLAFDESKRQELPVLGKVQLAVDDPVKISEDISGVDGRASACPARHSPQRVDPNRAAQAAGGSQRSESLHLAGVRAPTANHTLFRITDLEQQDVSGSFDHRSQLICPV
jgi:hypothetical protein